MTHTVSDLLQEFGSQVKSAAGEEVRAQVVKPLEGLSPASSAAELALQLSRSIERLDELAGTPAAAAIMERCGENCIRLNSASYEAARQRRLAAESEEAFLAAEVSNPIFGTRLELDGNVLYQIYTPSEYSQPMRCYCMLMSGMPAGENVSPTYCNCSRAFARIFWQETLGRPVTVEVLETALRGGSECRFKINL